MDTADIAHNHHYASKCAGVHMPAAQTRRVAKEAASLQALLPLSLSSSVFVRMDTNKCSLWRALITGARPVSVGRASPPLLVA